MSGIESAKSEHHDDGEAGRIGVGFRLHRGADAGTGKTGAVLTARGPVRLTEIDASVE